MMMTVFRLLAEIALYIANYFLKLDIDRLFNGSHVVNFKEFAWLESKHTRKYVVRENLNFSIKITNTAIIETTRCLDFVFGIDKLLLQLHKVLVCLKIRVSFSNCKEALQSTFKLVLSCSSLFYSLGVECISTSLSHFLKYARFMSRIPLNAIHKVWNKIQT